MGTMPERTVVSTLLVLLSLTVGCTSPVVRSQTPDTEPIIEERTTTTVGDMAQIWGMRPMMIEGLALTTNLDNTGSDPPANSQRRILVDDMKRRGVDKPNTLLSLPSTSLVIIRAKIPPGLRKGDRLDVEVLTPSRSETESLRNGWLMQSRLQEMAVLGNKIRTGEPLALAAGAVVVDALMEGEGDRVSETRGRILGGALSTKSRELGLILKPDHQSVRASARIGDVVNRRFHTFDRGTKRGVAIPKRDSFVEITVHSRYRNNLVRYFRVIQSIPISESPHKMIERMISLEGDLRNPKEALSTAVKLEALGKEAVPTLLSVLDSDSQIVRFAAAESLAYLDRSEAIPHLKNAAIHEPALRWHAMTALGSMVSSDSREALADLMQIESDEARYGAFYAIMDANPRDPVVKGEIIDDTLSIHEIPSDRAPLVHIRKTNRPEIVLFGQDITVTTPVAIFAGKKIMAKSDGSDRFKVSRFELGKNDTVIYCSNNLSDLIRTIVKLDGSYTDVVAAINHAKQNGSLSARVKFDALPKPGREYNLEDESAKEPGERIPADKKDDSLSVGNGLPSGKVHDQSGV